MVSITISAETPEEAAATLRAITEPQPPIRVNGKEFAELIRSSPIRGTSEGSSSSSHERRCTLKGAGMGNEKETEHLANGWKERTERSKAEKWERRKRLADALVSFIERVTDSGHMATDGELHALPGVADVCSRLL